MYYIIALCMGVAIATQAPINATLARYLQSTSFISLQLGSIVSALISFGIGTICLGLVAYFSGALNAEIIKSIPQQIFSHQWWKFLGGVLGAFFVFGTILLAPKIGLLNMFLLALVGQLITSLVLDYLGAFGLGVKPISWQKILGLGIILAGLLVFFSKELQKS